MNALRVVVPYAILASTLMAIALILENKLDEANIFLSANILAYLWLKK